MDLSLVSVAVVVTRLTALRGGRAGEAA